MNRIFLGLLILCLFTLHSCLVPRKVVYFNDLKVDSLYKVGRAPVVRIQKNDRLRIVVGARSPELAAPFNLGYVTSTSNVVAASGANVNPTGSQDGYLVDQQGNIQFPILGKIQAEGNSLEQLQEILSTKLEDQKLISSPTVRVDLINFKINMMGAISHVGLLDVPDGRITLLDAISKSGGITRNAAPDKIMVIREENGIRETFMNNIESKDIFDSPVYNLRQNDIVYVAPKAGEMSSKEEMNWRYISLSTGLLAIIMTIVNLVK